jgi:xylulokinase
MSLVAGVDSSTQSCKIVIRNLSNGLAVRTGSARHPEGTEVDPNAWLDALHEAIAQAGGLDDVDAISIGAQQHGMVVLDSAGEVIRPALLWNDVRSAESALHLIDEVGAEVFIEKTGSIPVASFTITKLRWLRDNEPENAARVAAVVLPHDWLTWRLRGFGPAGSSEFGPDFNELKTDRSDASGTGYFNSATNAYERELFIAALGHDAILPTVLSPQERAGVSASGLVFGAGAGDNAAAALGLGMRAGDVAISIGTSGTVFSIATSASHDLTGSVAGFADASGHFLPITVTLNAARVLVKATESLNVDFDQLAELALSAPAGSDGIVLLPFFEGERTPNLPTAKESFHGITEGNNKPGNLARAYVEGMLCSLAYGFDALLAEGVEAKRLLLIGGGAQNLAVQQIASQIFSAPVEVPVISEYVAEGASVQAAWALTGERPNWMPAISNRFESNVQSIIKLQYHSALLSKYPEL